MLNESSINCFLSLAETLSFTESARRLYLTQQAVSRNIMQLEAELDLPLVNRDGRVITLTPAGERCAVLFRDMSRRFTEGMDAIRREMDTEVRSVRAGFQNFLDFGAELFHSNELFRQRCPEAILKVERHSPGTLTKRLYSGALDLAVMHRRYAPTNPDYEIRDLFTVHLNILVSPTHPNVNESATYLDFRTQPFIIDVFEDESDAALEARAKREIALIGFDPSALITVPNRDSAYVTAEMSDGVLLSSDISQSRGPSLLHYRVGITDAVSCVWRKKAANASVQSYVNILTKVFAGVK